MNSNTVRVLALLASTAVIIWSYEWIGFEVAVVAGLLLNIALTLVADESMEVANE